MYQLIKRILRDPDEKTKITLLYGSKSEQDILLKNELEILQSAYPKRFKVHHIIDKLASNPDSTEWEGGNIGYVNESLIKKYMPVPDGKKSLVLLCGPEG